jgi:hypothetical protein
MLIAFCGIVHAELAIDTAFPGGSAKIESIDQATRTIAIRPSPHPDLGWECWWNFKLTGIEPGKTITLRVSGMAFALAERATFSTDGMTWQHTPLGKVEKGHVTYTLTFDQSSVRLAWGLPFQLSASQALIQRAVDRHVGAETFELTRSKGGNPVPALRWEPAAAAGQKRTGLWVHARQHAWESGSSWVCAGFVDWLCSDDAAAKSLRETTRIVVVPIMDVDNVELGAGGKDQKPHDHNRDWSDEPVFNAVRAAQSAIREMDAAGEFDLFIDLHNPGPNDRKPFFFVSPPSLLPGKRAERLQQWVTTAQSFLGKHPLGLADKTRESGPAYHPLWKQISKNWIAAHTRENVVAVTLETSWNTPNSTQDGYQSYGAALGRAVEAFMRK